MLPQPSSPLAGQSGLSQNAWVGSTVFLLSGCDWPRYPSGCSRDPLSTTSFHRFTVPWGATRAGVDVSPGTPQRSVRFGEADSGGPRPDARRPIFLGAGMAVVECPWADPSGRKTMSPPG